MTLEDAFDWDNGDVVLATSILSGTVKMGKIIGLMLASPGRPAQLYLKEYDGRVIVIPNNYKLETKEEIFMAKLSYG